MQLIRDVWAWHPKGKKVPVIVVPPDDPDSNEPSLDQRVSALETQMADLRQLVAQQAALLNSWQAGK